MNKPPHSSPANTRESSEILADALCEEIIEGSLSPGEKLSEEGIAKRFSVSRGPVREALRRLSERKLVSFIPNVGARVVRHSLTSILDLLEVRESLEATAAKLAAERMTVKEKSALRALLETHFVAVKANKKHSYFQSPADLDFHYLIAKGAANPILFAILCEDFYPHLRIFRRQHQHVAGRGLQALEEHRRIMTAIEESEAELAELLMRRHIATAVKTLKASIAAESKAASSAEKLPLPVDFN